MNLLPPHLLLALACAAVLLPAAPAWSQCNWDNGNCDCMEYCNGNCRSATVPTYQGDGARCLTNGHCYGGATNAHCCQAATCWDGANCVAASSCPSDGNECHFTCDQSLCTLGNVNNGTDCTNGFCKNGACTLSCRINFTYYNPGDANFLNACEVCQPSVDTTGWTTLQEGAACGTNRVCHNFGAGMACWDGCVIGGTFHNNGAVNPTNSCQTCKPSASVSQWTAAAVGDTCDTHNPCTTGACDSTPTCQPTPVTDRTNCPGVTNYCFAGSCVDTCLISTVIYKPGAVSSANSCKVCDPGANHYAWSNAPAGAACADEPNPCTSDACNAGGTCIHTKVSDGTSCGNSGQVCQSGTCVCTAGGATESSCSDGIDNDCNGLTDCAETSCNGAPCAADTLCVSGRTCQAGVCSAGTSVPCLSPPACRTATGATCDPATGNCSYPLAAAGTPCATSSCASGTCDAPGVCWPDCDAGVPSPDASLALDAGLDASLAFDAGPADAQAVDLDASAMDVGTADAEVFADAKVVADAEAVPADAEPPPADAAVPDGSARPSYELGGCGCSSAGALPWLAVVAGLGGLVCRRRRRAS